MVEFAASASISTLPEVLTAGPAAIAATGLEHVLATALLTTQFTYVSDHVAQELAFVSAGPELLLGECPASADVTPQWFAARVHPTHAPAVAQVQALVAEYPSRASRPPACWPYPDTRTNRPSRRWPGANT